MPHLHDALDLLLSSITQLKFTQKPWVVGKREKAFTVDPIV